MSKQFHFVIFMVVFFYYFTAHCAAFAERENIQVDMYVCVYLLSV